VNKFHVNPKTGEPSLCQAQTGRCPFSDDGDHFTSNQAARNFYEHVMTADSLKWPKPENFEHGSHVVLVHPVEGWLLTSTVNDTGFHKLIRTSGVSVGTNDVEALIQDYGFELRMYESPDIPVFAKPGSILKDERDFVGAPFQTRIQVGNKILSLIQGSGDPFWFNDSLPSLQTFSHEKMTELATKDGNNGFTVLDADSSIPRRIGTIEQTEAAPFGTKIFSKNDPSRWFIKARSVDINDNNWVGSGMFTNLHLKGEEILAFDGTIWILKEES